MISNPIVIIEDEAQCLFRAIDARYSLGVMTDMLELQQIIIGGASALQVVLELRDELRRRNGDEK